ncbi:MULTISPECIES: hypothetical protein [Paenibacillus]|uniref:hypothetical protein n=1 Tax=Paenibacillus TaxID=44249 RepID=UPI0015C2E1BE|nr:hypothetical protein [Paenibacillus odorifer]
MDHDEIDHFISLLEKWKTDDLNWGEVNELYELRYRFGDSISQYYWEWTAE